MKPHALSPARLLIPAAVLVALSLSAHAQDVGKHEIERPAEKVVERRTAASQRQARPDENPRVAPGLVRWHADIDAARAASTKSGKPVLLFQLLGRLDQEFC